MTADGSATASRDRAAALPPAPSDRPSGLRSLAFVLAPWTTSAGLLIAGAVVAAVSTVAGIALLAAAGGTAASGVAVPAVPWPGHRSVVAAGAGVIGGAVALRALGVARIAFRYGERLLTHEATFRALAALRVRFFRALAHAAAGGLGYRRAADLLSRLVADVDALDALYLRVAVPFVAALASALLIVIVLGRHDRPLGVFVGILLALAIVGVPATAAMLAGRHGDRTARAAAGLRVAVLDAVGALREVRAFGAADRMLAEVQARDAVLAAAQRDDARRGAGGDLAGFALGQVALFAVLLAIATASVTVGSAGGAGIGRAGGAVTAAVVAVFVVLGGFDTIATLPRAGVLAAHALAAARRVAGASRPPASDRRPGGVAPARARSGRSATTRPTAEQEAVPPVAGKVEPVGAELRFDDVCFAWRVGRPVFDGLDLTIQPGTRVAILGASGSGKSTLAQLALGLVSPDAGAVRLGGAPVGAIAPDRLHRSVALLNQSTHLFADTIRANLLIGRPDADDAALWHALDGAALGEWVRGLPDGLDSWLGEGGRTVSGGQGRRIALARALLTPAPVLILDEPASGLDGDNERRFFRALAEDAGDLLAGRTVILIAHRLTGVERLDRIWRLSGGRAAVATA